MFVTEKILPTIFPSQIHIQPDIKMAVMQPHPSQQQHPHPNQPSNSHLTQSQDMHIGSSQNPPSADQFINVSAAQSHSPHLPNASNLTRHISIR